MTAPIFRSTYKPPTRWFRFKESVAAFIAHPAIMFAQVVLIIGIIAAVVLAVVANGWAS